MCCSVRALSRCVDLPSPRDRFLLLFSHHPSTYEIYTLSLHDALPIFGDAGDLDGADQPHGDGGHHLAADRKSTSELQSLRHLVCRLLLEKKKKKKKKTNIKTNTNNKRHIRKHDVSQT